MEKKIKQIKNILIILLIFLGLIIVKYQNQNLLKRTLNKTNKKEKLNQSFLSKTAFTQGDLRFNPNTLDSKTQCFSYPKNEKISILIKKLKSPDWKTRANAAKTLSLFETNTAKTISYLIDSLNDQNEVVRANVTQALGFSQIETEKIVPALIKLLKKEKEEEVYLHILQALANIGLKAKKAIPILEKNLKEKNFFYPTILAIARINPAKQEIFPILIEAVKINSLSLIEIAMALDSIDPKAKNSVSAIIQILNNPENKKAQLRAAWILGLLREKKEEAIIPLSKTLKLKFPELRKNSIWALALIGEKIKKKEKLISIFIEALNDEDYRVRWYAIWGISLLGKKAKKTIPFLKSYYSKCKDHITRERIKIAIEKITNKKSNTKLNGE